MIKRFSINIPQEMFEQIRNRARVNHRSVNKEIISLLEEAIDASTQADLALIKQMSDRLQARTG